MKRLYCKLNGHALKLIKNVTHHVKEYECEHCKEKFTTSPNGYLTSLSERRKEVNDILARMHLKKLQRRGINGNISL